MSFACSVSAVYAGYEGSLALTWLCSPARSSEVVDGPSDDQRRLHRRWEALRALEESANLAHRMGRSARAANNLRSAERFEQQAENKEQHAGALRAMLLENENQVPAPEVKDAGIEQVS